MEIKDIFAIFKKSKKSIIIVAIVGILCGAFYSSLPKKYVATGSFYISRKVEEGNAGYFKYEGYYSQQNALSYTNTVASLLESLDIKSESLQKLGVPTNEENLRKYGKLIKVKKAGPQVVTLTVKEETPEKSAQLWEILSSTLLSKSLAINKSGDNLLNIEKISEKPVVKKEFDLMPLDLAVGGILGILMYTFYRMGNAYLKEDLKK